MCSTYLATLNCDDRDHKITFEEGPHIYTVNGERNTYISATTFVHSHFPQFDAKAIIQKMRANKRNNWNDPNYVYYNKTDEEIMEMWSNKAKVSSEAGTKMHFDIECYYNQMSIENESVEYSYFKEFEKMRQQEMPELVPYRTEWMVWNEDCKICGSIDMVFQNKKDGTLQIFDWKRIQKLEYENVVHEHATTECIRHLSHTNFWHYAIQLNLYRYILQTKYNKTVTHLYLVCLHPDNPYKSYELVQLPILEIEINNLIERRKNQLLGLIEDDTSHSH